MNWDLSRLKIKQKNQKIPLPFFRCGDIPFSVMQTDHIGATQTSEELPDMADYQAEKEMNELE